MRLNDYLTRTKHPKTNKDVYMFNSVRYITDCSGECNVDPFLEVHYRKSVEIFLNNCNVFAICPGCGLIDDYETIKNRQISHGNEKCQVYFLIQDIWENSNWFQRSFPGFFPETIKCLTKQAKHKRSMYTTNDYPTLLVKHKKDLKEDLHQIILKNALIDKCPESFADVIKRTINIY